MMKSMTGFGRGEILEGQIRCKVEIKSVNHRYCDVSIKVPRQVSFAEDSIRKAIRKNIHRGKIDLFLTYRNPETSTGNLVINEAVADKYVDVLKSLKERYDITESIQLSLLSKFPDLIEIQASEDDEEQMLDIILRTTMIALNNLIGMREKEGESLHNDITEKSYELEKHLQEIEKHAGCIVEDYRKKINERIKVIVESNEIDNDRLETEIAIFADKSCIDEEIVRLKSHIKQLRNVIDEKTSVGRKLDFLIQEFNREVNTIGSKSTNVNITNNVIIMKGIVEKIREQCQNIE